jgi:hypothetical protein
VKKFGPLAGIAADKCHVHCLKHTAGSMRRGARRRRPGVRPQIKRPHCTGLRAHHRKRWAEAEREHGFPRYFVAGAAAPYFCGFASTRAFAGPQCDHGRFGLGAGGIVATLS